VSGYGQLHRVQMNRSLFLTLGKSWWWPLRCRYATLSHPACRSHKPRSNRCNKF